MSYAVLEQKPVPKFLGSRRVIYTDNIYYTSLSFVCVSFVVGTEGKLKRHEGLCKHVASHSHSKQLDKHKGKMSMSSSCKPLPNKVTPFRKWRRGSGAPLLLTALANVGQPAGCLPEYQSSNRQAGGTLQLATHTRATRLAYTMHHVTRNVRSLFLPVIRSSAQWNCPWF